MFNKPLAAALLLGGTMMAAQPSFAQDTAPEPAPQAAEENAVIARVNGDDIRQSDLIAFIQTLPPQLQGQVQFLMPQLVQQLVNNALVTDAGRKADLAEDPEVQTRIAELEGIIIRQVFVQRTIDARVTDAKLAEAYEAFLAENPPERQLVTRHILVETEDAATALIVELDGGADFAALAEQHSTGPSKDSGGQLPPFVAGDMVPEFSDAAFAMEVGTHSATPVQTQFGFHVIKLEESRMTDPPSIEALDGQLRDQLAQEAVEELYAELRERADVEVLLGQPEPESEPAGEADAPAAPDAAPESEPAPAN
ncbi:peptidylprolyl isomerase [Pelagibius litoralis]|uniref:Parvulin-like PPIase n=1 Tax=Pelagibius litoralis TaxID=374515 RepID=A0A967F2T2_9PROT|nr:peptidylprolyl isomerase [Pelagibius litoralis]NIA71856.1 peptidylprolyl isomerase [Pelagibius litoralis]